MTTSPPTVRRRLLADEPPRAAARSAIDGAPAWASGVLAALQAALLSVLLVVLPALAAYVATSSDPSNAEVGWGRSVAVGAGIWLLAHGVPLEFGGVTVSVVPLGLTALAAFACYASARRSARPGWWSWGAGTLAYAAVPVVVALATGLRGAAVATAGAGGLAVGGIGLALGMLGRPEVPRPGVVLAPVIRHLPGWLRDGAAAGLLAAAAVLVVAALLTVSWLVGGAGRIGDVVGSLRLDTVGAGVLALTQVAYLPTLVAWAVAWLAGPGFVVGTGSHLAAASASVGPLPALPVLGALPLGPATGGAWQAAPLAVVACGALAGWWLRRGVDDAEGRRWWEPLLAVAVAASGAGALLGGLSAAAHGSGGPGRLGVVGADPWQVGLAVAGWVALGALAVVVPTTPQFRRLAGDVLRRLPGLRARGAGRADAPSRP